MFVNGCPVGRGCSGSSVAAACDSSASSAGSLRCLFEQRADMVAGAIRRRQGWRWRTKCDGEMSGCQRIRGGERLGFTERMTRECLWGRERFLREKMRGRREKIRFWGKNGTKGILVSFYKILVKFVFFLKFFITFYFLTTT